jgi:hypothetical protein
LNRADILLEWVFFQWPHNWVDLGILKDITFLEFVPIVLSMAIWGSRLQNKKVKFYIDNRALVDIINTQTSKSKRVMALMRPFILYTLQMQRQICYEMCNIIGRWGPFIF